MSNQAYACRLSYAMSPPFGSDHSTRKYVTQKFVEASSPELAIRIALAQMSVLSLEYGVTVEVVPIDWSAATRGSGKYTHPPMPDYGVFDKRAKLVVTVGESV